jgi:hypothetical protein
MEPVKSDFDKGRLYLPTRIAGSSLELEDPRVKKKDACPEKEVKRYNEHGGSRSMDSYSASDSLAFIIDPWFGLLNPQLNETSGSNCFNVSENWNLLLPFLYISMSSR